MRWEKADKSASGYTPVCLSEWKKGVCNKTMGKKCKDCQHAEYVGLSDKHVEQHLRGYKTYGIYPLLEDNNSYFIVADFDGDKWQKNILDFYKKCKKYKLPTHIERSRSGNGGHVWIFFEDKYPAYKSRNIAVNILKEAKIIDQFDKEDSFDRLFPNQDTHSGKGFGNLICLPLQGESRKDNNTIFLDPENKLKMFSDQWEVLQKIEKVDIQKLDKIYNKFNKDEPGKTKSSKTNLNVIIKEQIEISKANLPKNLVNFLRDELNFYNSEFLVKKKMGVSVYGMEKYFKLVETKKDRIAIPRGFLNQLISFLNESNIKFDLEDKRSKLKAVKLTNNCRLFDYQKEAVSSLLEEDSGILVAPPGAGKTIMGIELISKRERPALILVHKKQIFNQWLERVESFLGIPKREIGQICANKKTVGKKVTVAMVQTLNRQEDLCCELKNKFGLILVDECHHMPAKMFREVITKFNPYYLYGLTATPTRKHNDEKLIFIYLGDVLHTVDQNFKRSDEKVVVVNSNTEIIIKETKVNVPFKVRIDNFQVLSKIITFDSTRNQQIIKDVAKEIEANSRCLLLTERKEHVEVLSCYLKKEYEIITLTGDLTSKQREEKVKQIESGHFQIILATGQLIGEGADFPNLDCLFLVYPFSFHGKLIQYIGRIQRGVGTKKIYDYRDVKIDYLEKFFKKRLGYYKKRFGI